MGPANSGPVDAAGSQVPGFLLAQFEIPTPHLPSPQVLPLQTSFHEQEGDRPLMPFFFLPSFDLCDPNGTMPSLEIYPLPLSPGILQACISIPGSEGDIPFAALNDPSLPITPGTLLGQPHPHSCLPSFLLLKGFLQPKTSAFCFQKVFSPAPTYSVSLTLTSESKA